MDRKSLKVGPDGSGTRDQQVNTSRTRFFCAPRGCTVAETEHFEGDVS